MRQPESVMIVSTIAFDITISQKCLGRQCTNEFWNLAQSTEWHHLGEGNMAFYDFGVACPTVSENVRRARRFAAMFIGEDPEAPNYDTE